ncbi:MAG: CoA-substrate-specific enzyme activase [Acetothermia bacterium 64_32]|nr:MAG: CoA-substrate-specific enzyme activase [Acetothermia bacterium 64_32]HAF71528.1 hypothetical protein [Candidatus Acetothermia bacterium]
MRSGYHASRFDFPFYQGGLQGGSFAAAQRAKEKRKRLLALGREAPPDKPCLILELDGRAGIITRLEAYLDPIALLARRPREAFDPKKIICLPYMADHNFALEGALAHFGYHAESLPPPDEESLALGRKYATGGECLPFILTTGDFLKLVKRPRRCSSPFSNAGLVRILEELGGDVRIAPILQEAWGHPPPG